MEKWEEYLAGSIPKAKYEANIKLGEKNGLVIELLDDKNTIKIGFGNIISFRVLEEGYVQKDIYNVDELAKYKSEGFANMIYKVEGGKFAEDTKEIADGYMDFIDYYHFIIITQNYNIDIVTEFLPEIIN